MLMRCTSCSSCNIVWDYGRGEVICCDCGTVLDKIYVSVKYSANIRDLTAIESLRTDRLVSAQTRLYLKLLGKALRHGLTVDNQVLMSYFLGKAPLIKVFKNPNTDVGKLVKADERLKVIMDIINRYPRLASRTERAKIALAKIALSIMLDKKMDPGELGNELGLSKVHVRRLYKAIIECPEFLHEVSKALTPITVKRP